MASASFDMTEAAAIRIAYLLSDEPEGTMFKVAVEGGGCSGFQYRFDLNAIPPEETDYIIQRGDAKLVVDETSLEIIKGSVLDYTEDMASAHFEIKNPNAAASCGCGNSFSVAF